MSSMENKFSSEGFVVLKDFLSAVEVSELLENVDRFIAEVVPSLPDDQVFYEEKDKPETLKQIQFMFKHDSYFQSLMVGSTFEHLAAELLQQPVRPVNMQYFNFYPCASGRGILHAGAQ
jgi:phytanoyl-CoA hydroxylase